EIDGNAERRVGARGGGGHARGVEVAPVAANEVRAHEAVVPDLRAVARGDLAHVRRGQRAVEVRRIPGDAAAAVGAEVVRRAVRRAPLLVVEEIEDAAGDVQHRYARVLIVDGQALVPEVDGSAVARHLVVEGDADAD